MVKSRKAAGSSPGADRARTDGRREELRSAREVDAVMVAGGRLTCIPGKSLVSDESMIIMVGSFTAGRPAWC